MARWLGVDHGLKVLGVAVSDPSGFLARPLTLIKRRSKAEDFAHLARLLEEHQAEGIVVGLPLQPGHGSSKQAESARRWSAWLAAVVSVPVLLWDESFSSLEAERLVAGRRRGGRIDDAAAAVMLQGFLDARRENPQAGEQVSPAEA
jgi:putative Holliday junction resolvase